MIASFSLSRPLWRAVAALALLTLGAGLGGCAGVGESLSSAFVDPARYDFYECKQLESERKALANRGAEYQGLIAKAQTGVGGSVVAELAYRNDYISTRAQAKLAEEVWQRNKCHETPPTAASTPPATPPAQDKPAHSHSKSGSVVY